MSPLFRGRLHHLSLGSPEPGALAAFYRDAFDMAVTETDGAWICRGRERCLVFRAGAPKSLAWAGYQVSDRSALAPLRARVMAAGAAATLPVPAIFEDDAVAARDPDGNLVVFGIARPAPEPPDGLPARLQHVVIASRDPRRIVRFYADVIGFRETDHVIDGEGALRTAFLRSDDEHHSFAVFMAPADRLDHHCYEAVDWNLIRDWGDHFAARRIPIKWGPGRHGPGNNLFLFIHDPDGNWVEISAELEIAAADRPVGRWPHEERTLNSWGQAFLRS